MTAFCRLSGQWFIKDCLGQTRFKPDSWFGHAGTWKIDTGKPHMTNTHPHAFNISRQDRERLNGHPGGVVWFTGLSGSGKSTLANALEVALHQQGKHTFILDGDHVRQGLNKDLGFSEADRAENIRRIAEVARLMGDAGLIVITAFISPFRREREMARQLASAGRFCEVYVDTSLALCEARDPKGLYKKARSGQLANMTGIHSPCEIPENPDIVIHTDRQSVEDGVQILLEWALAQPVNAPRAPGRE
jgi:adenylyl-sulfate kinase